MPLTDARANLKAWLEDLAALKAFVDPNNPDAKDFSDAWGAAMKKAKEAAKAYAVAVGA